MGTSALIIEEGASRLRWAGAETSWRLVSVWPSPQERLKVTEHLEAGRPLLVVLDRGPATVPVWRSELGEAGGPSGVGDDEVLDLPVPFLDWLPAEYRERGLKFLEFARSTESLTPRPLLAPLLVEETQENLRFAYRTVNATRLNRHDITTTAERLFPEGTQHD